MAHKKLIAGHNDYFPILQRHLERDQYDIMACGQDTPSVEEIESFAAEANAHLPFDFIDFSISRLGGLYLAVKEELWPRPKAGDVGPFWSMLYGMYVYGFARGIPEFMNIRVQTPALRARSGTNLLPCLKIIGDADFYGFDSQGAVRRWDHETGDCPPVEKTFIEILEFEVMELAARNAKKQKPQ